MAHGSRNVLPLEQIYVGARRGESVRYIPRQKPQGWHPFRLRAGRKRRSVSLSDQLPIRHERTIRLYAGELQLLKPSSPAFVCELMRKATTSILGLSIAAVA